MLADALQTARHALAVAVAATGLTAVVAVPFVATALAG